MEMTTPGAEAHINIQSPDEILDDRVFPSITPANSDDALHRHNFV
jgi:hypothetical protein